MPQTTPTIAFREAFKLLMQNAAPFLLVRGIEVTSDIGAILLIDQLDKDAQASAILISSTQAFLRGVTITYLSATGIIAGTAFGEVCKMRTNNEAGNSEEISKKEKNVGKAFRAGIVLAFALSIAPIALGYFSAPILKSLGQPPTTADIAQRYFRAYVIGLLPTYLFALNQQITQSVQKPWVNVFFTLLNRVLMLGIGAAFTYGLGLGVEGIGYGYSIAATFSFLAFCLYQMCHPYFKNYQLFHLKSEHNVIENSKSILRNGLPIAGYAFAELGNRSYLAFVIGLLGETALKSAQPAVQYSGIFANLIYAFGQGSAILISNLKGNERDQDANVIGNCNIVLGLIPVVLMLVASIFAGPYLNYLFIGEDHYFSTAHDLLIISIASQLFDALRNTASGASRGLFKSLGSTMTDVPMCYNLLSIFLLSIPLAPVLTLKTPLSSLGVFIAQGATMALSSMLITFFWHRMKNLSGNISFSQGLFLNFCCNRKQKNATGENTPLLTH